MLDIFKETGTKSLATFYSGLQYPDIPVLTDQQKTYIHLLCLEIGCRLEDLPQTNIDGDEW